MGVALSKKTIDFEIIVKTGDVKGAGTDSNVYCVLVDKNDTKSRDLLLDVRWRNDFEKGSTDLFKIRNVPNLRNIKSVQLWRDKKGIGDDWFVEVIKVKQLTVNADLSVECEQQDNSDKLDCNSYSNSPKQDIINNNETKSKKNDVSDDVRQKNNLNGNLSQLQAQEKIHETFLFPCNRWIEPNMKYLLLPYDSILPQFDPRKIQRSQELDTKKTKYVFADSISGVPRGIKKCPTEEHFSNDYKWDIVGKKMKFLAQKKFTKLLTTNKWNKFEDLLDVYKGSFGVPYGYNNWRSDASFGQQRLRGCNPTLIELCTEVPENFPVTNDMVQSFLDGLTLDEAAAGKELYIVNLKVLENLACKNCRVVCPAMALFHLKKNGDLIPIAIQLQQTLDKDNPIFLPSDPPYTWMLAKMYFNNADCALHQSCTHLGFTHLVVESICVTVHRTLSPSHPVFRLLAPHFLYLLAINSLAVQKLLSPEGWIDVTMTMGVCGLFDILKRTWGKWRMDIDGWLPADLKKRGVDDTSVFPSYMYRDDSLMIHTAIVNYVTEVLTNIYDAPEKLLKDFEIQAFGATLVDDVYGAAVKGVFGGGKYLILDDLIKTIVSIIFLSSVGHAAANFCQYDEYAFPPNYPAQLYGEVPKDKKPLTEQDIINHLPNKDTTLSIMVVTKILSDRGTNGLGDFEIQYQYEPKAVQAVERFRAELREISQKIKDRNKTMAVPYSCLDPEEVPNAISI